MPDSDDLINSIIDSEDLVSIGIDSIDADSKDSADEIIDKLLAQYHYSKNTLIEHPDIEKTISIEKDALKTLLKLRSTNDKMHDVLIKQIEKNSEDSRLYTSLVKMQQNILAIQKQIDEKIEKIKNTFKSYQLEINFNTQVDKQTNDEPLDEGVTIRGSKDFIKSMLEKKKAE